MLEPLIVSTPVCDLITSKLSLAPFKRSAGIFGKPTERRNLLIIGDVDSDFLEALSLLAVKSTLIRTVPRTWDAAPRTENLVELVGVDQLTSLDSHQFPLMVIADPLVVAEKSYHFHLWRVLDGTAKCVLWVPAYMTNPIDLEALKRLGALSSEVTSLSEYNYPGNHLHFFETRKDRSEFHQT